MDYRTVEVGSLVLGQERMENLSAGVVPDESLDLGNDSEGNAFPADFILGWDVIGHVRFAFDRRKKEVLVKPGGGSPQEDSLKWDRFPEILIDYQGEKYPMGFDTGHTKTMLDDSLLNRIQGLHSSGTVVQGIGSRSAKRGAQHRQADLLSIGAGSDSGTYRNHELRDSWKCSGIHLRSSRDRFGERKEIDHGRKKPSLSNSRLIQV